MIKTRFSKKMISIFLVLAMLMAYVPLSAFGAEQNSYNKIVDKSTMDNWSKYFNLDNLDTTNAGGVWTDKSVFTDASAFDGKITMLDGNKNFLTALSAIAANKEIVGYSTVPTDTIMVLDLSGSMSAANVSDLVDATNAAINELQSKNENNRVGVVLYSGSSSERTYRNAVVRLLPLGRYSVSRGTDYIQYEGGEVSVVRGVTSTNPNFNVNSSKDHGGATYIQAGLWEAYEMFNEVSDDDIYIEQNNWQAGKYRMPILVLMSDGAPSLGTTYFSDVKNSRYGYGNSNATKSDVGDGNDSDMTAGQSFLVQLTASYIRNRIENKYKVHEENGAGRSLFYTLGFNISRNQNRVTPGEIAYSVLNPDNSTVTDSLWNTYNRNNSVSFSVEGRSSGYSTVTVNKNSYATSKSYVDKYFAASGTGLSDAFNDIVEEIILQSRYYPTHLEGSSPDFSGYVDFTDTLGDYMEVKHINGILIGNTLFNGQMMASKLNNSTNGLGSLSNPTELGQEFFYSIKTRLGITDDSEFQNLISKAYADGQLKYVSASDWSNYIAWYAKSDMSYLGFYDEDGTEPVPEGAAYIIRSYVFLGETSGSIKNSDMMYMTVRVQTNITTGQQTVRWKIPAALVPMITYLVSLDGVNVDTATNVRLSVENAGSISPIRLIYETGLRSDINEFNVTSITDSEHVAPDGHTRTFWNNYFYTPSNVPHTEHKTALAEFVPNKSNERFYYTTDSAIFKKSGNNYVLLAQNEQPTENGEYYHRRYIFKEGVSTPEFRYERLSNASISVAKWQGDYETLTHEIGAWIVPKGTPTYELEMYSELKGTNLTSSAEMIFYPYLTSQNNFVYVDMNLGNNGMLSVIPESGIKISKTVDVFEAGTNDTFRFRVTISGSGSYDSYITAIGETPSGAPTAAQFINGVYEVELKKDQTLWIAGLPAGTAYSVEEISTNSDYRLKSVHVNGVSSGAIASGTVAQYLIDDVSFVNTAIGEGNLVVTKEVVDENNRAIDVNDNVKFTVDITLKDSSGTAISGIFPSTLGELAFDANGKATVTLSDSQSIIIRGISEGTNYTVEEINVPNGFKASVGRATGTIVTDETNRAVIKNVYAPTSTNGDGIDVRVTKKISGNRTHWIDGESYTFVLERRGSVNQPNTILATDTISANDANKSFEFSLSAQSYTQAGTYYYRVYEVLGNQGGISYDTLDRRFSVVVADTDLNGSLEIVSVNNEGNTSISGQWIVAADFNNIYEPSGSAKAKINVKKEMIGNRSLNGYQFALYDSNPITNPDANEIVRSTITNASGDATIVQNYTASDIGKTHTFYLAEINFGQKIGNIQYSSQCYLVEVSVFDNYDGTIYAETTIQGVPQGYVNPVFVNEYIPSASDFVTINGTKEIIGDRGLNANEFQFKLTSQTSGAPMPSSDTVWNNADGSFSFDALEFTANHLGKSYVYTVEELDDNKIGGFVQYDQTVYTVTVTLSDNGSKITATASINGGNSNDIVFRNVYNAEDAKVSISGTKILTGKALEAGEFSFELKAQTPNAPMPSSAIAQNSANGDIVFGDIIFDKAGAYVYSLTEIDGGIHNFDYDKSVYTITVTVTDNSQGKLYSQVRLSKNGLSSSEIIFRNNYVPDSLTYDINAEFGGDKVMNGRELKDKEFEFALINAITGEQIGETVRNNASGEFRFPAISLSSAQIYHFKIVETIGDEKGVTYDNSSFHVRLEVVQLQNGKLSIKDAQLHKGVVSKVEVGGVLTESVSYENITDGGKIKFVNSYSAEPTSIYITGTKILRQRTLEEGEFTFELLSADGDLLDSASNEADGSFSFHEISVSEAGEYVYTVREIKGSDSTIIYDEKEYTVKVLVEDNYDGTFKILYTYFVGNESANGIQFVNVYNDPTTPDNPSTGYDPKQNLLYAILVASGGFILAAVLGKKNKEQEA